MNRALAHGMAQGGIGAIRGQKFGAGFLSGFAGSLAGSAFGKFDTNWAVSIAGTGAIGGFSSRLGGGSFEDGFASAAAVQAFNHGAHEVGRYQRIQRLKDMWFEEYGFSRPMPLTDDQLDIILNIEGADLASRLPKSTTIDQASAVLTSADGFFYRVTEAGTPSSAMLYRLSNGQVLDGGLLNYRIQGKMWQLLVPLPETAHALMYSSTYIHNKFLSKPPEPGRIAPSYIQMLEGYQHGKK